MKNILREQAGYPRVLYAAVAGSLIIASLVAYQLYSPEPTQINQSPAPGAIQHTTNAEKYPLHRDITATVFWAGEQADPSNDFITNTQSYWITDWTKAFGGVDDPEDRCGFRPCGFTPKENPFYFALPYGDRDNQGNPKPEAELQRIPWYENSIEKGESILKNRWIQVSRKGLIAYAQWEDVGPFGENDMDYVFGDAPPKESRAGLDLSPATAQYLGIEGRGQVDWRFVDEKAVPSGPWTEIITRSGPDQGS
jgi:hypothetical protein